MIDKLVERIKKLEAPIVAGLDPDLGFVPEHIKEKAFGECGHSLEGAAQAIWQFNKGIIDAIYDLVPAVKPQIAMYEQFGLPGLAAFTSTVDYCHSKGLIVIGDIKRGDIGSTSAAYARGHIGSVEIGEKSFSPFKEDFATLNPYMGSDSIEPFMEACRQHDKGLFVLVKTSNPSSGEFQDKHCDDGRALYEHVAEKLDQWAAELMGEGPYSEVGAVVGATYPQQAAVIRKLIPRSYILVPGYGAQGATAMDILPNFNKDGLGAIVNSSRGIIAAYRQEKYSGFGGENYADASRAAVIDMRDDINSALATLG